jgi:transposase
MAQRISILGMDIGTTGFHVVGMNNTGRVVLRERIGRRKLWHFFLQLPPLRIGIDACGSAHVMSSPGHPSHLWCSAFVTEAFPTSERQDPTKSMLF